jgi:hypothetical protein
MRRKISRGEKGFSLITVIFVMMLLSSVGIGMSNVLSTQALTTVESYQSEQALYVADGGLQHTISNQWMGDTDFSDNVSPTPAPYANGSIPLSNGEFWVQYSNQSASAVTITVTSRVENSIRKVRQTLTLQAGDTPYDYAVYGNGNLSLQGGTGTINGNISAGGNISNADNWTINGSETPNNSVALPDVDVINDYSSFTSSTYSGNTTISGNYSTNIYITGNLDISSNTTINGYIVVGGNIKIGSNVTVNGMLAAAGNIDANNETNLNFNSILGPSGETIPALVASGNLSLGISKDGVASVNGYMRAEGNLHITNQKDSTFTLNGFMVANGNFSASNQGIVTINYNAALAQAAGGGPANLTYTNWKEV